MSETITFLEMNDPADLREPSSPPRVEYALRQVHDPNVNRDLYTEIGGPHKWVDRLRWTDQQWAAGRRASRPGSPRWTARRRATSSSAWTAIPR